jgi:lipoprotein NlpD
MTGVHRFPVRGRLACRRNLIGCLLIGIMLLSCSGYPVRGDRPRGIYHHVKSGETLSAIAEAYHVNLQELAEINHIDKSGRIEPDSVLFIPDANQILDDVLAASRSQVQPVPQPGVVAVPPPEVSVPTPAASSRKEPVTPPKKDKAAEAEALKRKERVAAEAAAKERAALARAADRDRASRRITENTEPGEIAAPAVKKGPDDVTSGKTSGDKNRFIWPVSGKVVTKFGAESIMGEYNGKKVETARIMNNGVKIAAPAGAPVVAAAAGKVIYSMMLERFGNTIIIEHADDYKTVYYDLGKRLVDATQQVRKGDQIATIGGSKASKDEAFMNFEIRQKNRPRNPLLFLP